MIQAEQFSFAYEEEAEPVLRNVSFTIEPGESVLLLGPSGSGKSSLALCLNGLYPGAADGHSEGTIRLNGRELHDYPPGEVNRHVGAVFQDPDAQFCMLTAEDEVAFGLENMKVPPAEMKERIHWALSLVGLEKLAGNAISSLSGGQKQKLALACILAMKPDFIILDEPTALLDPAATRDFARTMARLQQDSGFALLVIEHKLDHWLPFMDRCLVLGSSGELIFDGPPRDCFQHHRHELKKHGIWLPNAMLLAEQLGITHRLPFNEEELLNTITEQGIALPAPPESPPAAEEAVLEAEGVTFSRKGRTILREAEARIPRGSLTALVGPNGSGKTTLSYLLAGLLKPEVGEIRYNGISFSSMEMPKAGSAIGYVFQNPEHQFVADTVYDEIAYGIRLQKLEPSEIDRITSGILSACRLQDHAGQHPYALSQGQKRRLSVATMLVDEQPLLILDEPTYGQDAGTADELLKMMENRLKAGHSVLMITHDMELVHSHAETVMVLDGGHIRFHGPPQELFTGNRDILEEAHLECPLLYSVREKLGGGKFAAARR